MRQKLVFLAPLHFILLKGVVNVYVPFDMCQIQSTSQKKLCMRSGSLKDISIKTNEVSASNFLSGPCKFICGGSGGATTNLILVFVSWCTGHHASTRKFVILLISVFDLIFVASKKISERL